MDQFQNEGSKMAIVHVLSAPPNLCMILHLYLCLSEFLLSESSKASEVCANQLFYIAQIVCKPTIESFSVQTPKCNSKSLVPKLTCAILGCRLVINASLPLLPIRLARYGNCSVRTNLILEG